MSDTSDINHRIHSQGPDVPPYPDYDDSDQCAFCGETVDSCACDERIRHAEGAMGETDAERNA